ncbi:hypothetical protein P170DRAFT_433070 [Aspergillus steynii IBT 23096]|uniref:Uncharacterized protein n=1 Tax=Aspergillus steynii IBT 23096 TaxID=1392250 RepID=A0A2I2GRQ2_9EURO|nr:uncharacterized protein P170DRAFT_433070 [Aspergillus steynii IBT 23096]PLB55556.1 hypothetical protein P170DRAFT_433070 [Aspergillus steynii IBT 23096]
MGRSRCCPPICFLLRMMMMQGGTVIGDVLPPSCDDVVASGIDTESEGVECYVDVIQIGTCGELVGDRPGDGVAGADTDVEDNFEVEDDEGDEDGCGLEWNLRETNTRLCQYQRSL